MMVWSLILGLNFGVESKEKYLWELNFEDLRFLGATFCG